MCVWRAGEVKKRGGEACRLVGEGGEEEEGGEQEKWRAWSRAVEAGKEEREGGWRCCVLWGDFFMGEGEEEEGMGRLWACCCCLLGLTGLVLPVGLAAGEEEEERKVGCLTSSV